MLRLAENDRSRPSKGTSIGPYDDGGFCSGTTERPALLRVLQGALATLRKYRPRLLIEVYSHYLNCERNGNEIAALIEPLGYTSRRICQNRPDYYYLRCECR